MNQANPAADPIRTKKPKSAMPESSAERKTSMSEMMRVKKQNRARTYCPRVILVLEFALFGIKDFCIVLPINR